MEQNMNNSNAITIKAIIAAPVNVVWKYYTEPEHVTRWNHASDDWHTTSADNDLRPGGKFSYRMEAKDKSFGFDFGGVYDEVVLYDSIHYTLGDNRKVHISFLSRCDDTQVVITFDAESENPIEMQRSGWNAILTNFKRYVEELY